MFILALVVSFSIGAFVDHVVMEPDNTKVTCQCLIGVVPMDQIPENIDQDYDTSVR
jgi:hypothetical protein